MDKRKVGNILGFTSIIPVITSVIVFYTQRGPNADIYFIINIFVALSILGIFLAIFSWLFTKRLILFFIAFIGNIFVLAAAFLLLLAMGISEP
ncbi:hypothetical protein [Psychrobacillus sp. OK032]|uniref:hypothetical protein n=1 Tax=Psychrobacillus sp. OK032 TaxID=1884358 RepID=UPI0008C6EEAF|nr:hypothetical protein [Psychrobacillus sp. OK032]SES44914.1 hypothetical protein SAMN05518872_11616 [Psychrobacillus sp. OK032]